MTPVTDKGEMHVADQSEDVVDSMVGHPSVPTKTDVFAISSSCGMCQ